MKYIKFSTALLIVTSLILSFVMTLQNPNGAHDIGMLIARMLGMCIGSFVVLAIAALIFDILISMLFRKSNISSIVLSPRFFLVLLILLQLNLVLKNI